MAQVAREGLDIHEALPRMHEGEDACYFTDGSFWSLVERLANASPPLVAVDVAQREPRRLPRGRVTLTQADSERTVR